MHAHLQLCLYIELCKQLGLSGAFLFVDVVCAFASLVRDFVLGIPGLFQCDDKLKYHLRSIGMDQNQIDDVLASMHSAFHSIRGLEGNFDIDTGTGGGGSS